MNNILRLMQDSPHTLILYKAHGENLIIHSNNKVLFLDKINDPLVCEIQNGKSHSNKK